MGNVIERSNQQPPKTTVAATCVPTRRRMGRWSSIVIPCLAALPVKAGVCEELEIPMDTVEVPGVGWVCKVRECGTVTTDHRGLPTCVTCNQEPAVPGDPAPQSEFCPKELGRCDNGRCVPSGSSWYARNYGKPWTGLGTFSAVTATHYGGAIGSCGRVGSVGDVDEVTRCFERIGIDGPAAVPIQMFGSYGSWGQGCWKRNNLCYKLVGVEGVTRVVTLTDRCNGFAHCTNTMGNHLDTARNSYFFQEIPFPPGATIESRAEQCINTPGSLIFSGLAQRCWYFTDGGVGEATANCCPGPCMGQTNNRWNQVDWCASQSHPHFDLPARVLDALCDNGRGGGIHYGSCQLQWVEPIKCPVHPKPGKCCRSSCSATCDTLTSGTCADSVENCRSCGGTYCDVDADWNICDDVPPPPDPTWTPRPTDPPATGPMQTQSPRPPPEGDPTPTTWPGATTLVPTTPCIGCTGTVSPTTPPPGVTPDESTGGDNSGIIIGSAAAGVIVVAAVAALAARGLSSPPAPIDAAFEGDVAEEGGEEAREEVKQAHSEDFQ